jgi:hypothetical protein
MMFLDCPAYLDQDGTARCGLPAEVRCRFTMRSTDGPVESAMIRCPAGHYFCGAIGSLTWDGKDRHDPDPAGPGPAPGGTVSSAVPMAATAADPPTGMSRRAGTASPQPRTALPPTTWAGPPTCGSPPCARAAGAPPPAT